MSGRRLLAALLALAVGAAVICVLLSSPPASAAPANPAPSGSAVTKSGTGEFAGLKVTVSQTENLIDQTVTVSWTGGEPTVPADGEFGADYLQIMQCWGDNPSGPDRTQCQFGGSYTQPSPTAGTFVRSRQVNYGANLVDPKEALKPPNSTTNIFVPFWAVGQPQPALDATANSNNNDFFDSQVTNEDPVARTHGDGTGEEFFEVQTVVQSAGLGCGAPLTTGGVTVGRPCWLVIVPRGNTEVDGSTHAGQSSTDYLISSPLSQSNWDQRIVFPLAFLPVGQACPLGAPERPVIGHELVVDAVSSWQPVLCAGGGALYSYTQLPDDVARSKVLDGSSPGLALVTNPIPPEQVAPDHPLVYAPVALSGLAIAFNIEHQPPATAPPQDLAKAGLRFSSMKLTPRLVAKLLTQSYRGAVIVVPPEMKNNPIGLTVDPEFLARNPDYAGFANFATPPDALVQLNGSDVTSLLWSWVIADPDARAFLNGTPDSFGMAINPKEKGLALPTFTFPRNDQSCKTAIIGEGNITGQICTADAHPFATDMHDAGRSASRGDSKALTTVLATDGITPVPKKLDRQAPGQRALLAVVDVATATRYGLPTAALRNAAGQFVTPSTGSLLAGEAAMKPSAVPGVLASDPVASDPAAYPLTALSYAITAPSSLDATAARDYATFLRYAAGPGQQPGIAPGQLPLGLVPLPDTLKAQTITAAARIQARAGKSAPGAAVPQPARSAGGGATGGQRGAAGTAAPGGGAAGAAGSPVTKAPSVIQQQPAARVQPTPSLPKPVVGVVIVIVLICGGVAATSSPVMYWLSTRTRGWARNKAPTEW